MDIMIDMISPSKHEDHA